MRTYAILTGILIHKFFSIFYPAEYELTVNYCEYKLTQIKEVLEPHLINLGFNMMYYYTIYFSIMYYYVLILCITALVVHMLHHYVLLYVI